MWMEILGEDGDGCCGRYVVLAFTMGCMSRRVLVGRVWGTM